MVTGMCVAGELRKMPESASGYILVIDDAAFMRRMITGILKTLGHDVLEAPDGPNAIKTMRQDPPKLVIVDLMMPHMSGQEVCAWIRSNPPTASVPIIVCTANQERKYLEQAIRAGASDILFKPVTRKSLQERVEKQLQPAAGATT